ncbi:MAG: DUF4126 domain-containing protein [Candidatus Poseidoniaceae archaeon]
MEFLSLISAISVGIGLSAACGFRIFLPPAMMSLAANLDWMELDGQFAMLDSWGAFAILSAAVAFEIGGYFIPWIDNLLDIVATPAAALAGVFVSASMLGDFDPMLQWAVALIAGGGAAGTVQIGTVATRAASTGTTGGLANPLIAIFEAIAAVVLTILALLSPIIVMIALIVMFYFLFKTIGNLKQRKAKTQAV